jgi:hypothetical protein
MKRGFREARSGTFEMRYWSKRLIRETLQTAGFKDTEIEADGYFSQNPQLADLVLLSGKFVVMTSYAGTKLAQAIPPLVAIADSLWVKARKSVEIACASARTAMAPMFHERQTIFCFGRGSTSCAVHGTGVSTHGNASKIGFACGVLQPARSRNGT